MESGASRLLSIASKKPYCSSPEINQVAVSNGFTGNSSKRRTQGLTGTLRLSKKKHSGEGPDNNEDVRAETQGNQPNEAGKDQGSHPRTSGARTVPARTQARSQQNTKDRGPHSQYGSGRGLASREAKRLAAFHSAKLCGGGWRQPDACGPISESRAHCDRRVGRYCRGKGRRKDETPGRRRKMAESISANELSKVRYLDVAGLEGRTIKLMPLRDGAHWHPLFDLALLLSLHSN